MSKNNLRRNGNTRSGVVRARAAVAIAVALLCVVGVSLLAQISSRKKDRARSGEVSTTSFSPTVPSKEMIYAGTRLLASEEPCISGCLVDDTDSSHLVVFNSSTGDYVYCCGGVTVASGRGVVTGSGCSISITHVKGNRTVYISADGTGQGSGSAYILNTDTGVKSCQITDTNTSNNVCNCS